MTSTSTHKMSLLSLNCPPLSSLSPLVCFCIVTSNETLIGKGPACLHVKGIARKEGWGQAYSRMSIRERNKVGDDSCEEKEQHIGVLAPLGRERARIGSLGWKGSGDGGCCGNNRLELFSEMCGNRKRPARGTTG